MEIGQCLRACRAERLDREATLFRLATSVEGVYVPQFYQAPEGCACAAACCRWPGANRAEHVLRLLHGAAGGGGGTRTLPAHTLASATASPCSPLLLLAPLLTPCAAAAGAAPCFRSRRACQRG